MNELQSLAAKIMGKEDALLVTSGTQGNLVSLMAQTNHGDEIILEQEAQEAVALDKDAKEFTKYVDSVMFCLSKGLAAPIGSLVVGSSEFIEKARKIRKMFGGGLQQAGIIAAPSSVALKTMIPRLKEDHENAKILAHALVKHEEFKIDLETVQTNMIFGHFVSNNLNAYQLAKELQKYRIKIGAYSRTQIRLVTHYGITSDDIKFVIDIIDKILSKTT